MDSGQSLSFFVGQFRNVKPANRDNSRRASECLATRRTSKCLAKLLLVIGLVIGCCADSVVAQGSTRPKSTDDKLSKRLWHTENLPDGAICRYGSTDRNPSAIGIYAAQFSSDGKLLAVRDRRQNVRILDLENRKTVAVLPTQAILDFVISPDKKFLVTGNRKRLQFWGIESGAIEREVAVPGYKLAISPKPIELVAVGKGMVNRFPWPFPSRPKVIRTKLPGATVLPVGVSEDGTFAVLHNGSKREVIDTATGEPVKPTPAGVSKRAIISRNLHLLADVNYGDSKVTIFDLRNAKKHQYILEPKRRIVTAAFSCDSRFLFTSNYDNAIVIWDLVTMQVVHKVKGHGARIEALAANPNQPLMLASGASGTRDRSVLYWDFRDRLFPKIEDAAGDAFDFDQVWNDLGSDDAAVSLTATNQLSQALRTAAVMTKLQDSLGLNLVADDERALQLIEDLDSPKFVVREKATMRLKAMVETVRPMLERRLNDCSQEAKWRINRVLSIDQTRPEIRTPVGRRAHRVVLALELCGGEKAMSTLKTLGRNAGSPSIAGLANEAIGRLVRPGN